MSERVVIPYTTDKRGGAYVQPSPAWFWANEETIWVRCACGQIMSLADHEIAPNGEITPSLWHDTPDCGWHVFGTLAGYTPK